MNDKWRKVRYGLAAARKYAPAHYMIADADDCVSRHLAGFAATQLSESGWYLERGYMYCEGSRFLVLKDNFYRYCGTSAIVRCERQDLPQDVDDSLSCFLTRSGHVTIAEEMARLGRPLSTLPIPGAIYITGTGENDSGLRYRSWESKRRFVQEFLRHRLVNKRIREEFGLNPLT
jgi:hypothetical protein